VVVRGEQRHAMFAGAKRPANRSEQRPAPPSRRSGQSPLPALPSPLWPGGIPAAPRPRTRSTGRRRPAGKPRPAPTTKRVPRPPSWCAQENPARPAAGHYSAPAARTPKSIRRESNRWLRHLRASQAWRVRPAPASPPRRGWADAARTVTCAVQPPRRFRLPTAQGCYLERPRSPLALPQRGSATSKDRMATT
jgi:hypothetical protein